MAGIKPAMTLLSDSWTSDRIVMAGLVPAIHVFLAFQYFSEPLPQLNFRIDAAGSDQYPGRIPIR
jgi:hypothetical protein